MSIINVIVDPELRGDSVVGWDEESAVVSVRGISKRLLVSRPSVAYKASDYIAWGVRARGLAESNIQNIVFKMPDGTRRTIGCVFPISSFDPDSDYCAEQLEDRHQKAFSSHAATLLVERGIANDFVNRKLVDLDDTSKLCDLFDQETSIAIIGIPLAKLAGVTDDKVRLALQEYGYFLPPRRDSTGFKQVAASSGGHKNIESVAPQVERFVSQLTNIVAVASVQSSPAAAFLCYYQVIEIFSQERFKAEVLRITQDEGLRGDAWALREKLTEAAGERRRLESLMACCVASEARTVNEVQRLAKKILKGIGLEVDMVDKMSAAESFYKIRNLIVHDQQRLSGDIGQDLENFVYVTHSLVFALMRSFDATAGRAGSMQARAEERGEAGAEDEAKSSGRSFSEVLKAVIREVMSRLKAALMLKQSD